ncbi:MAG: hypothetical protein R2760_09535 [Chitinophagales bacterium]
MENNKEILDELNELSPLLNSLKEKGNKLEVLANYFQEMQKEVLSKLEVKEDKLIAIKSKRNYFIKIGVAASVAFLLLFLVFHLNKDTQKTNVDFEATNTQPFSKEMQTDINNYISENIDAYSVEEVGQFVAMQTNNKIQTEAITTSSNAVMTDEEINQFVENNPVYISDLYDDETATIF